jgi:hypothetical protein
MRSAGRLTLGIVLLGIASLGGRGAHAAMEESPAKHALHTGIAVVANVVPVVPALYAPRCLPGYVLCKVVYAGISVIAATGQLVLSGGQDLDQTRGILYRGFKGDWYLTARHVSGQATPEPLPDPPPPASGGGGHWEPPPL